MTDKSQYYNVSTHEYDQDVFLLLWGSVAAALSCALENWPPHSNLYDKITTGYKSVLLPLLLYLLLIVCVCVCVHHYKY